MLPVVGPLQCAGLVDLFFPQPCLLCGDTLLLNRSPPPWTRVPLCRRCLERLRPLDGPRCRICSQAIVPGVELCVRCRTSAFPFAAQRSVFAYGGEVRELIAHYKFQGQRALARLFAHYLAESLRECYAGLPVVPVPSRPETVRRRGWDHVGLIAQLLERRYGFAVRRLLARSNGRSQKTLDFEHRLTNLKGKIRWAPERRRWRAPDRPAGALDGVAGPGAPRLRPPVPARVVLLDDVFTTGATASECTRVLNERGVGEVQVLTLAVD